jgi:hypothetical protein
MDMTYYVSFVDENGCETDNLVSISYEVVIYVPNTFIPDGNDLNDLFGVYGGNISAMKMVIFDRWGELIYRGTEPWAATEHIGQVYICIARVLDRHGKLHSYSETFTVLK